MGIRPPRQGSELLDSILESFAITARSQPLRVLPFVFLTAGGDKLTIMLWDFLRLEELGNGKTKVFTSDGKNTTVDEDHNTVIVKMQLAAEAFDPEE